MAVAWVDCHPDELCTRCQGKGIIYKGNFVNIQRCEKCQGTGRK